MRWPFWRRAVPAPMPPHGPVVPLTTVSDRHRPTVTGFGLPDVAGTRSLLARPPIVPGPTAPRGRLYGTVMVRHVGPPARRGRLPSLRHLFTGQPSTPTDTPRPWAVRVIDRPPEPTSFDESTDAGWLEQVPEYASFDLTTGIGWPEPHPAPESASFDPLADAGWPHHVPESVNVGWPESHQVPQAAPFDPFGSPAPSDEDWITSDAIADLQAVLTAARGTPAPTHRTAPAPSPVSQPIRRLTLAESRRRGITSAQPPPADDNSPSPIEEPPASDQDLAEVEESTAPPDPIAPTATIDPEPPDQADAPPARARVTRLIGRPSPDWSPAVDPLPTSSVAQSPSAPDRSVSAADAERAGRGPERSVQSGHASVAPQRSVPAPGVERGRRSSVPERSGRGSLAPEQSVSMSGVEASAPEPMTGRGSPDGSVSLSGAEQSVTGLGPLAPGQSASMSDAERSMTGRGSSVPERSAPSAERLIAGRDSSVPERSVSGAERMGRGPLAQERSVADDSPLPGAERDQPTPAGDVPTIVRMLAGHDQPAHAGDPWPDRSTSGRDRLAPEWPAAQMPEPHQPAPLMPGLNQPDPRMPRAGQPDPPMQNAGPEATQAGHPVLPPRTEPPRPASMPDNAFAPRLGLGRPLPPGTTRLVTPPADLAAAIQNSYGVDVSATPIHRGPAATARAATLSAKAFTERGEVFLPDQLGPLTTPTARAGLAHELTHVAQQRILGADLPAEWTPAGQALEQHAVAAENHVRTGQQMTPPPILGPPEMSTADSIQRQPEHDVPLLSWTAPTPPDEPPEPPDELAGYADRLVTLCGQRLANLDDSTNLDELAEKIYHRLRDMLRGELLVDRERAGLLTDFC